MTRSRTVRHGVVAATIAALAFVQFVAPSAADAAEPPAEPDASSPAVDEPLAPEARKARHARAILEQIVMLGAGSIWYWASRDLNSQDWDVEPTFRAVSRRFTTLDNIRFDSNEFVVNQGHVFAGAMFYAGARTNGVKMMPSLLYAVASSAVWEWVNEFREHVSINDLVTSPYGGQAIGEVFYKLGEVHRRGARALPGAARWLTAPFSGPARFHDWLDGYEPPFQVMQHDFEFGLGAGARGERITSADLPVLVASLSTRVWDLPGRGEPGRFSRWFKTGNITRLDFDLALDGIEVDRADLSARATLAGRYWQNYDDDGGWGASLGLGRGVWLTAHDHDALDDVVGMVDIIGPMVEFDFVRGSNRLSLGFDTFLDFGSVGSLAYPGFAEASPDAMVRTELERNGYYFAWGVTMSPRVELQTRWIGVGTQARISTFHSLGGPDRIHKNEIPTKLELSDDELVIHSWFGIFPHPSWEIRLRGERARRRSRLSGAPTTEGGFDEAGLSFVHHF